MRIIKQSEQAYINKNPIREKIAYGAKFML